MHDAYWMPLLEKHNFGSDSMVVKMTGLLLLTRRAWLVAVVFGVLFAFKNTFKRLYYWCDAHFPGRW